MLTVAEVVAQTLKAYDTEYYFCVTGGDHDLWIALHDAGIRIINCRSESAATYMADGYARVTGRPGFVYGQRGPGAANVAAALADAYWGLSPVVSLTTSIALATRDRFQYQDIDTLPMHAPVTIWNKELSSADRAADLVRGAIRAATTGVPGPVHLEIPADMLARPADAGEIYRQANVGVVSTGRTEPDPAAVAALLARLRSAQRPLILAGKGVILSQAWPELGRFADALGIPVATTLGGKGSVDERSDLAVGVIGRYSRRVSNEVAREADAVLAIGTRLGGLATHAWSLPFGEVALMQIDVDPQMIGHNFRTEVAVVGDAKLVLQRALAELAPPPEPAQRTRWALGVTERVAAWRTHAAALERQQPADGIHPAAVLGALRRVMTVDDLLAADTGAIAAWAATLFPVPAGQAMIRSAGSLGWVLPGALGAALGAPQRRTVALTGDGGLLYHIGELETAVRCGIPLVVVVLNNRAFASEHHLLKNIWHRELPEVVDFHDVDFAAVAEGFGVRGITVRQVDDLDGTLTEAFSLRAPVLIDVRVSKEAQAPTESFRGDSPV
jgi:acetolactate synthase-1/2/3 large subunit